MNRVIKSSVTANVSPMSTLVASYQRLRDVKRRMFTYAIEYQTRGSLLLLSAWQENHQGSVYDLPPRLSQRQA